jgi:hypothetical protein
VLSGLWSEHHLNTKDDIEHAGKLWDDFLVGAMFQCIHLKREGGNGNAPASYDCYRHDFKRRGDVKLGKMQAE